jgi:hypothetical protein
MSKRSSAPAAYSLSLKHNYRLRSSGCSIALCAGDSFFGKSIFHNFADMSAERIQTVSGKFQKGVAEYDRQSDG